MREHTATGKRQCQDCGASCASKRCPPCADLNTIRRRKEYDKRKPSRRAKGNG